MNKHSTGVLPKLESRSVAWDLDLSAGEVESLLQLSAEVKREPERFRDVLRGRYVSLLFEKPSLRTRITFELAIKQLGGDSILSTGPAADREPIKDVARNLARWTNCIVARTFSQWTIEELARWSSAPVINALSDLYHPCQALADIFTLKEQYGNLPGLKLAFVGDGNNVAHSLMLSAPRLGIHVGVATPPGYEPRRDIVETARGLAAAAGVTLTVTNDPAAVLHGADAVYTDVWASMGQEGQREQRLKDFQAYQVDEALMSLAKPEAVFMHCLPAKRGEEVSEAVIESPRSVVFDQAENRLHTQKALLLMLLA